LWAIFGKLDLFLFRQTLLSAYVIGFALIQLALALVHTSNQSIIFRLRPDAKSRINAIYMTTYFIGGAGGSALGIFAWNRGGWTMTCLAVWDSLYFVFYLVIDAFLQKKQMA
jgi:predicted MFS family arabinose efflux permease